MIEAQVFWVVTLCSDLVGYHITVRCHKLYSFHPESGGSMVLRNVVILPHHYTVSSPWRWRQHGPPKRWYCTTSLQGVYTLKMVAESSSETMVSYHIATRCLHLEEGNNKVLRNVSIVPHH